MAALGVTPTSQSLIIAYHIQVVSHRLPETSVLCSHKVLAQLAFEPRLFLSEISHQPSHLLGFGTGRP